jgi:hypothetical protein
MKQVFYHCATAALYAQRKDIHFIPLLVFPSRFCSYWKPNFPAVSGSYLPGFSGRICSYWQPNFPAVSGSYFPGFSGRICSYWQPNFPAVSVVTGFSGLTFSGTRRPGFSSRICCFWPGIPSRSFSGMGNLKNSMGSRQIVLVSTAGFSVLNTGIFWREAKTKRLFSQCIVVNFPAVYRFHMSNAADYRIIHHHFTGLAKAITSNETFHDD